MLCTSKYTVHPASLNLIEDCTMYWLLESWVDLVLRIKPVDGRPHARWALPCITDYTGEESTLPQIKPVPKRNTAELAKVALNASVDMRKELKVLPSILLAIFSISQNSFLQCVETAACCINCWRAQRMAQPASLVTHQRLRSRVFTPS